MHLAQDANFCLNNWAHKRGNLDKALQPGSAYMVDQSLLEDHVKKFVDNKDVRDLHIHDLCCTLISILLRLVRALDS
jgi:hypothetical protein